MENLVPHFIELIRRASTDLPADMEIALRRARANEDPDSAAQTALDAILENVQLSRQGSTPICQDTGTPIFYVYYPTGWSTLALKKQIREAVAEATARILSATQTRWTRSPARIPAITWVTIFLTSISRNGRKIISRSI